MTLTRGGEAVMGAKAGGVNAEEWLGTEEWDRRRPYSSLSGHGNVFAAVDRTSNRTRASAKMVFSAVDRLATSVRA